MKHHVHAVEHLRDLGGQDREVLAHVRVGHHADPHGAAPAAAQNPMAWKPASTKRVPR